MRPNLAASETGRRQRGALPTFLIIGAMRSGTTSLARYLGEHEHVFMAPRKELHFFDREFHRGEEWYRRHFPSRGFRALGEATQSYMYDPNVPERIATMLPGVQLIAILRNPTDRAYSHYWLNRAIGLEDLPFHEALEQESVRLSSQEERRTKAYSYVDRGRYVTQLRRVCEWFPRDRLHVLLFEDLRDHPMGTYQTLCDWLEIEAQRPLNLGETTNAHVRFRSRFVRNAARRAPRSLRRAIGAVNVRRVRYAPMNPILRQELDARFTESNAELSSWLGRDLGAWKVSEDG